MIKEDHMSCVLNAKTEEAQRPTERIGDEGGCLAKGSLVFSSLSSPLLHSSHDWQQHEKRERERSLCLC